MSTTDGNDGIVKVGANAIAEIQSWSLTESADVKEDTSMGDAFKTRKTGGIKDWNVTIDCWWDATDTNGQETLEVGSEVALVLLPGGDGSGDKQYAGNAIVTSINSSGSKDGIVTRNFSADANGALTKSTVA
ncbi:hypothetical protein [Maritalea sp.]|jgi:hypothetical protein|uniref:hypothetical protein n=1 Tax=Maritalea sp. TaxID=2003361 RepID=UPI0039E2787F